METLQYIWVFDGIGGRFPSAVFSTRELAEAYIKKYQVSGTLTRYPIDIPVYEYVIEKGWWKPSRDYQSTSRFIQSFSSAYLEHFHYARGLGEGEEGFQAAADAVESEE
ncbi:MAG: hypothetical protein IJU03_08890 [Thermoguttaceae bacterium]|nr:hypothetical protein [Thermoguttaceae bacterium]